jgi:curli biogenesis system outer membrane secretion channel CsgG
MKQPVQVAVTAFLGLTLAACATSPTISGQVKDDVSVTGQTQRMEAAGAQYSGPQYTIAIIKFANKTPSKSTALGEAATDILRTLVKNAGLEPIDVSQEAMQQQEELIKLQQTGAVKAGKKSAAEGFDSVDYRIQGAITAYSEVEEGSDMLLTQKKVQLARVQVDYSLVDVASGKSLLAESGMGEYRKETGGVLGMGSKSTADTGLRDGALRDAFSKVMEKMIVKLNTQPFTGRILLMDGQTAVIRAGEKSKLPSGAKLGVYRPGQDLIDPETGRSLGKREKQVGELMLTGHQNDRVSEAKISSGAGFQAGDIVRAIK